MTVADTSAPGARSARRSAGRWARAGLLAWLVGPACMVDYGDETIPGLSDAPAPDEDAALVFERSLRWWTAPVAQRARLLRQADGGYLLVRERWDGSAVYGWATAELTEAGATRLAAALAAADPSKPAPGPGDRDCLYVEALPATVYLDGEPFEYASLCPPEGLAELAGLYEEIVELLLDCPLDPSWVEGEPAVEQRDCAVAGEP